MKIRSKVAQYTRNLWPNNVRKSARALVIQEGRLLVMLRKRFSMVTGEWIEYYSIPGGGIESGEAPELAVVRELHEEMGIDIKVIRLVAHRQGKKFEHYIYAAEMVDPSQQPILMPDSEEALDWHTDTNQFIPMWVDIDQLTEDSLRYYSDYLGLIQAIARGQHPKEVLDIDAR